VGKIEALVPSQSDIALDARRNVVRPVGLVFSDEVVASH
jgi:hypothetical protein